MDPVQHACFFFTAGLFWRALTHGPYGRAGYGVGALCVFATALHTGLLGAMVTLGKTVWYPTYATRAPELGMIALEDQQLAGLILWVPAGVLFAVLGLALIAAWLGESERRVRLGTVDALTASRTEEGFMKRLTLAAVLVAGLAACDGDARRNAEQLTGGSVQRGKDAITVRGCGSCHVIPGIAAARGRVGPSLDGLALRMYLAGRMENTPANLMAWVSEPHKLDPKTVMPNTGVTQAEARDIAAYLYTLR